MAPARIRIAVLMIIPTLALALSLALALPVMSLYQKFVKCPKFKPCLQELAIITDYKALLCTPQEGGPKVTEGAPYFRYVGAWGPHIYCKMRSMGAPFKGGLEFL